ncbi:acyltransferase-domain-containing protein [Tothia fuscella]|uniref:1-acyl-sn-glycerol-3-phosphate acyltransferase n=1 Tax=Tothia fuscella TaxID=1048955 RepID=A0A9P4TZX4_9PEZI|nr:acyltransferase-domain-containing protein [Tothia fuscella]
MSLFTLFTTILSYTLKTYFFLTLSLYILSWALPTPHARLPSFFARVLASVGALVLCASYGFVASFALRCIGEAGLSQWTTARAFKWSMYLATGVWFDIVEGEEYLQKTRPAVFVGNHQTELDVLFLGAVFPKYISVSAKRSLKWTPILGQFMWASKTIFIDRANSQSARATFDSAASTMNTEKQSVFIFPEGTRSYSQQPALLPFKKGAFHLAVQAQVPVVPIVAANYSNVLTMKGGWKKWKFTSGRIPVKVLRPIKTAGLKSDSVEEISRWCRDDMLRTLREMDEAREGEVVGNGVGNGISSAVEKGKKMSQMQI